MTRLCHWRTPRSGLPWIVEPGVEPSGPGRPRRDPPAAGGGLGIGLPQRDSQPPSLARPPVTRGRSGDGSRVRALAGTANSRGSSPSPSRAPQLNDHGCQLAQHRTGREHHTTGRRRDVRLEADNHGQRHSERLRRRHKGRVPRRHDRARSGHKRAVFLHVEQRPSGKPRPDRARNRQRRRPHGRQPSRDHCAAEALSCAPVACRPRGASSPHPRQASF